jgi:hypothetical protein
MPSYAELLGIDIDKLQAERHHRYVTRDVPRDVHRDVHRDITPPPESSEDWQPIATAANAAQYSIETIRRYTKAGKVRWQKRKGRIWVYVPDVKRHANKP